MIAFISGGVRSGKSSFAEDFALSLYRKAVDTSLVYVATAIRADSEMATRINHHIQTRSLLWNTIETPFELIPVIERLKNGDIVLIDCLTIWLSNQLYERKSSPYLIKNHIHHLLEIVRKKNIDLIIVSNDLNEGLPLKNAFVSQYIYTLEKLHMEIICQADLAIQVVAGIPIYWKGDEK